MMFLLKIVVKTSRSAAVGCVSPFSQFNIVLDVIIALLRLNALTSSALVIPSSERNFLIFSGWNFTGDPPFNDLNIHERSHLVKKLFSLLLTFISRRVEWKML